MKWIALSEELAMDLSQDRRWNEWTKELDGVHEKKT